MSHIAILLNGASHLVSAGTTLAEFVSAIGQPPQSLGTAVNGVFVPREGRGNRVLSEGDAIFTFQPITGG